MKPKSPQYILEVFKEVLTEASKFYGKPKHLITTSEFEFTSAGRLGMHCIAKVGGYGKLREYVAPNKSQGLDKETKKLMERILGA